MPSLYLKWHYRSTHESLIAFSNSRFYENRMFTFPSANDRERRVKTVRVEGVYRNGTNPKEAEAVVQEILRRYLDPELRTQSIGVVTFNVKQQALIENLLMRQYQRDPELDLWANSGEDPLFVKNLENVQGDERDAILFSITYGPDERGRISMNFGPVNQEGGSKRLNVAFSRSRISMTVFASMGPEDMKVTDSSPELRSRRKSRGALRSEDRSGRRRRDPEEHLQLYRTERIPLRDHGGSFRFPPGHRGDRSLRSGRVYDGHSAGR